jgi:hypothetical protein
MSASCSVNGSLPSAGVLVAASECPTPTHLAAGFRPGLHAWYFLAPMRVGQEREALGQRSSLPSRALDTSAAKLLRVPPGSKAQALLVRGRGTTDCWGLAMHVGFARGRGRGNAKRRPSRQRLGSANCCRFAAWPGA